MAPPPLRAPAAFTETPDPVSSSAARLSPSSDGSLADSGASESASDGERANPASSVREGTNEADEASLDPYNQPPASGPEAADSLHERIVRLQARLNEAI